MAKLGQQALEQGIQGSPFLAFKLEYFHDHSLLHLKV